MLWAFFRRDYQITSSYRASLLLAIAGGLFTLTAFHFLAEMVGTAPTLQGYGTDYFSFALLGLAVASVLRSLQTTFARRLRESQADGSLEILLLAPVSTFRVIVCLAGFPVLSGLGKAASFLVFGAWFFHARLSINFLAFSLTFLLAMVPFAALGLFSAAVVLVLKRSDPFTYALDTATYLLCGVLYPVELLPSSLRWVANVLPATHALEALRAAGLRHAPLEQLLPSWGRLILFAAVLWPLAALALAFARRHVERTGTLPHG